MAGREHQLGIHAPYGWFEASRLVVRIGELANSLGVPCSYMASQAHEAEFHPLWDRRIVAEGKGSFAEWIKDKTIILWSDLQPKKLQASVARGCRNVLVATDRIRLERDLGPFDAVVFPSEAAYKRCPFSYASSRRWIGWDSGTPLRQRPGRRPGDGIKVYAPLDRATLDRAGNALLYAVDIILRDCPQVTLAASYPRKLKETDGLAIELMQDRYGPRFIWLGRFDYLAHLRRVDWCDWLFYPSVADVAAVSPLEALAAGARVLAYNVPPVNEVVRSGYNGILVSPDTSHDGKLTVRMEPLVEAATAVFQQTPVASEWSELEDRRRQFTAGWRSALRF